MSVYVISYDLSSPGQNYDGLLNVLRDAGAVRVNMSVWLVDVNQTAKQLRDAVLSWCDKNDRVFVSEITLIADWAGYNMMPPSAKWLMEKRP